MKKLFLLSVLAAGVLFAVDANAQSQGEFRGSLGVAIGSKASVDKDSGDEKAGIGLNAGVEYFLIDKLSLAPSFTYYFPTDLGEDVKFNASSLNIDARFYVVETVYAAVGYSSFSNKISSDGANISSSEGAFNLGAGAMIPVSDGMNFNLQLKYQSILDSDIDFNQIVGQIGVAFTF